MCYDIVENRRRTRVMKIMKGFGFHAQKSVFECYLDQDQLKKLTKLLKEKIDLKEDSIRIYPLCSECVQGTLAIGVGEIYRLEAVKVV